MASVFPFRAWHPHPKDIKKVASPPYDVINTEEARQLAEGNPESFLHIIRPEIDLPEDTSFNHPDVYKKGAANLQRFIEEQILIQDDGPDAYLYQLKLNNHSQTGLFCCVSVDEYDNEVI